MYYKMRILPVIFLFSMMTKAQDKVVLGFLIHGVNLILNKGGNPYQSSFTADTGTYRVCADKVVCKRVQEVKGILLN